MKKILLAMLILICFSDALLAQNEEEIVLTTYYPAPFGTFDNLTVNNQLLPPSFTTAERDAIANPPAGSIIFNETTNQINYFDGATWGLLATAASRPVQRSGNAAIAAPVTSSVSGTAARNDSPDISISETTTFFVSTDGHMRAGANGQYMQRVELYYDDLDTPGVDESASTANILAADQVARDMIPGEHVYNSASFIVKLPPGNYKFVSKAHVESGGRSYAVDNHSLQYAVIPGGDAS